MASQSAGSKSGGKGDSGQKSGWQQPSTMYKDILQNPFTAQKQYPVA